MQVLARMLARTWGRASMRASAPASRFALTALLTGAVSAFVFAPAAHADDLPTFQLTFKPDGTFEPQRLEVPAGRFKIELINASGEPVEFESLPLRKEKVLGPGVRSFVVITISKPGEYPFFDDFHQNVKGALVVK